MTTLRIVKCYKPSDLTALIEEIRFVTRPWECKGPNRASYRFRYRLPITVEFEDVESEHKTVDGHMQNISQEGISFTSPHHFVPWEPISVTIEATEVFYKIDAIAVYSLRQSQTYRTGARLILEP